MSGKDEAHSIRVVGSDRLLQRAPTGEVPLPIGLLLQDVLQQRPFPGLDGELREPDQDRSFFCGVENGRGS